MVRTRLALVILLLVAPPVFAADQYVRGERLYHAPDPPWCPTCFVTGWVDLPSIGTAAAGWRAPVAYGTLTIAGWAFECTAGGLPDRYEVWYSDANGFGIYHRGTYFINHLPRPDVQAAFMGSGCDAPPDAGYHIYFTEPIPRGTRRINVNVWYGGVLRGQEFWITIY